MTDTTDRFRDWDAAYVLGALDSEDRRAFERHLATCPVCSAAVAEFAGVPGILSKLSIEDAVALLADNDVEVGVDDHLRDGVHTPGLVQRLAAAASRRRRRRKIQIPAKFTRYTGKRNQTSLAIAICTEIIGTIAQSTAMYIPTSATSGRFPGM